MEKAVYLENTLRVSCHRSVKGSAAHVVLNVGVGAGLQKALGSIGAGVAGSQVESSLACAVSLVVEVGTLVYKIGDNLR